MKELKVGGRQRLEVAQMPGKEGRDVHQCCHGTALFSTPITRDRNGYLGPKEISDSCSLSSHWQEEGHKQVCSPVLCPF